MARWTDLAEWVGPTINEGDGDGRPGELDDRMYECRGLVLHIAEGTYAGTISWQRNPAADVSSHFIAAKDGRCAQMVDTDDRAWTQAGGNGYWLSVECEGFSGQSLTDAQIETVARLCARGVREFGWPLQSTDSPGGRGLGWHGMGGAAWGNHPHCPGEPIKRQRPAILARAAQLMGKPSIVEGDMPIYARTKTNATVWASNGVRRRPVGRMESIDLVGGRVIMVDDEIALTDLCGAPDQPAVDVDVKALAKALAPLVDDDDKLPAPVVDALARIGAAVDTVVALARGE